MRKLLIASVALCGVVWAGVANAATMPKEYVGKWCPIELNASKHYSIPDSDTCENNDGIDLNRTGYIRHYGDHTCKYLSIRVHKSKRTIDGYVEERVRVVGSCRRDDVVWKEHLRFTWLRGSLWFEEEQTGE